MTHFKTLSTATTISVLLSGAAFADVTSEQIWADIQSIYESAGYTLEIGSESQDGNTLNVNDIVMKMPIEGEDMLTVSGLSFGFEQLDDGTVSITAPEEFPVTAQVEDVLITLLMTIQDMSIIASGDDTSTSYDFSAGTYKIALKDIKEGDIAFSPTVVAALSNMTGSYTFTQSDILDMKGMFDIASADIEIDVKDPENPEQNVVANINVKDMSKKFAVAMPEEIDPENLPAAFDAGLGGEVSVSHSGVTYDIVVSDPTEGFDLKGSSASGNFKYGLSKAGLGAKWGSTDTQVTLTPTAMPLPISFTIDETDNELRFPVSKSETPEEARLKFKVAGLSVDEALWGMIDPNGALPHDGATLIVDLKSKLNLDFNLFDAEAAQNMEGDSFPGQLHSLDINALQLSVAGAEFTGSGGFTFNNDDLETFDGLPAPTGGIDLKLVGGNALLDSLVKMGLIPKEQAMGARMMTGLFANAGEGEDELVSKIEVSGDGSISANGQRIK